MRSMLFYLLLLLCSCGLPMFDVAGKGTKDRTIYYNIATNEIISNYKNPMTSVYVWKNKNDSSRGSEKIVFDTPTYKIILPILKDSVALYDLSVYIQLKGDHWRETYHIDVTKKLVAKKGKIYSRYTSH